MSTTGSAEDATQFALRSADALAGNLNTRRTALRLMDLVVPRFGCWARLVLDDGGRVTVVDRAEAVTHRRAPEGLRDQLRALAARGGRVFGAEGTVTLPAIVDMAEVAAEVGAGPDLLEFVACPVRTGAADVGVLVVAGAPLPRAVEELGDLVRRGSRALTTAQAYEERTALASTLRAAVVPPPLPNVAGARLGAAYRPAQQATQVGGDFYEVRPAGAGRWWFSVGDVCGKGVEAAVLTGQVRQSLHTAARVTHDPAAALELINQTMLDDGGENFVTLLHGLAHARDGGVDVRLATGGHPAPLLLRGGEVARVEVSGTLVGMRTDARFGCAELRLDPGDLLLVHTDGATEAHGASGLLGDDTLAAELADCHDLPAQTVADRMMQLVMEHLDGRRHDDIAFLTLRAGA